MDKKKLTYFALLGFVFLLIFMSLINAVTTITDENVFSPSLNSTNWENFSGSISQLYDYSGNTTNDIRVAVEDQLYINMSRLNTTVLRNETNNVLGIVYSWFYDLIDTFSILLTDTFGGDVSGTYDSLVITDNSHKLQADNLTNGTFGTGKYNFPEDLDVNNNITGNVHYAELWNYSANISIWTFPIDTSGVYYNLSGLACDNKNGFNYSGETQANGGSFLMAQKSGLYRISLSMSFESNTAGGLYGFSIAKNFQADNSRECYARRVGTGNAGSVSKICLMSLEEGDTVNVQIEDEENPAIDILIHTVNLNLMRIGN